MTSLLPRHAISFSISRGELLIMINSTCSTFLLEMTKSLALRWARGSANFIMIIRPLHVFVNGSFFLAFPLDIKIISLAGLCSFKFCLLQTNRRGKRLLNVLFKSVPGVCFRSVSLFMFSQREISSGPKGSNIASRSLIIFTFRIRRFDSAISE